MAYSRFADNDTSTTLVNDPETLELGAGYKWQYATADVDVGYHPQMPAGVDVRLSAGLRAFYSDDSADKVGNFSEDPDFFNTTINYSSEFIGGGPRVGAEFEARGAGNWGLSGMIAGSALFGERTVDASIELEGLCPEEAPDEFCAIEEGDSESESATVYNLDAAIGLDYYFMNSSKFTLGVRAQQFWDLRASEEFLFKVDEDSLVWGPFFKFVHRM